VPWEGEQGPEATLWNLIGQFLSQVKGALFFQTVSDRRRILIRLSMIRKAL